MNSVHHLLEGGRVASLAGGDDGSEDVEGGVDGEVNLGGQSAARASQTVVVRLGREAVRTRPAQIVSPLLRARRRAGEPGRRWSRPSPSTR